MLKASRHRPEPAARRAKQPTRKRETSVVLRATFFASIYVLLLSRSSCVLNLVALLSNRRLRVTSGVLSHVPMHSRCQEGRRRGLGRNALFR